MNVASNSPPRRRWYQFSLRSLLILVTLISLVMGWKVNQYHREAAATRKIVAAGGEFYVTVGIADGGPYNTRPWLPDTGVKKPATLAELWQGRHVFSASLGGQDTVDLSPLADLPYLERVEIHNTVIYDLSPLYHAHRLKSVRLRDVTVRREELQKLQHAVPDCEIIWD